MNHARLAGRHQKVPLRARTIAAVVVAAVAFGCGNDDEAESPAPTAVGGATSTSATTTTAATQEADPATVFRAFVDAINQGDSTAAEALLSRDATWERGGQCPPGQCRGLARLQQEIARDVAAHHRIDALSVDASSERIVAKVELRTDQTRAAGVERLVQIFRVSVSGGKITAVFVAPDLSDEVTAAFVSQRRGQ